MIRPSSRYRKGFTLIELLVVISIIGMLSSVVLVSLQGARDKGRVGGGLKFATYNYHAFGADMFALYNFNGGSGGNGTSIDTLSDESGNARHMVCGDVQKRTDTPVTSGFSGFFDFGGCEKRYTASFPQLNSSWTASIWAKPTANEAIALIQVLNTSNQRIVNLAAYGNSGALNVQCGHNSVGEQYIQADGILPLNKWTHVACTYSANSSGNGGVHTLYIDGKKVGNPMNVNQNSVMAVKSINIGYIPSDLIAGTGFDYSDGYFDDAAIYTQSLPTSMIEKIYLAGLPEHLVAQK